MDVREKLVELIGSTEYGNGSLVGKNFQKGFIEKIASNLIANGVTVQEWISVTERLPEEEERVLIYTKTNITNYGTYTKRYGAYRKEGFICQDGFMWLNTASHWMPLPQPPKGE